MYDSIKIFSVIKEHAQKAGISSWGDGETEYLGRPFHTEVSWLSRVNVINYMLSSHKSFWSF